MFRRFLSAAALVAITAFAVADDSPGASTPPAEAPKPAAFSGAPVQITLPDGSRALRVTRLVMAPIADVWKTWASSEGLSAALGKQVTIEPRVGGAFEILWKPDAPEGERGSEGCVVQAFLPERMIAFTWNAPPQFGPLRNEHSLVVVTMDEVAQGVVRLELTHHGFGTGEGWDGVYAYFTEAWPYVMDTVCATLGGPLTRASEGQTGWVYLITDIYRDKNEFVNNMTDDEKKIMGEHSQYLTRLTRTGTVIHAGPCTDMIGPGIVIFFADTEDAARKIMQNDPAVKNGIFITELHPLAMSLLRERDRVRP